MIKRFSCIVIILLLLSGCVNQNTGKIKLTSKYYNVGDFVRVSSEEINDLKNESFIVYTYNNFCSFAIPCEDIFREFMQNNRIDFLSVSFEDFKNTYLYDTVKYAPSIIIVNNGKVVAYLDADSDEDLIRYQDVSEFKAWISKYVSF